MCQNVVGFHRLGCESGGGGTAGDMRAGDHWRATARISSTGCGQRTCQRVSRHACGAGAPGSRSRSDLIGLNGRKRPARPVTSRTSAIDPMRRSAIAQPSLLA